MRPLLAGVSLKAVMNFCPDKIAEKQLIKKPKKVSLQEEIFTQRYWQILIVDNVLPFGYVYPPGFLEESLLSPVWIQPFQLCGHPIVFSHE